MCDVGGGERGGECSPSSRDADGTPWPGGGCGASWAAGRGSDFLVRRVRAIDPPEREVSRGGCRIPRIPVRGLGPSVPAEEGGPLVPGQSGFWEDVTVLGDLDVEC